LVEPAARLEFAPESNQTQFALKPIVAIVAVSQPLNELLALVSKVLSEPTVLSAVQGLTVVRESHAPSDQVETKHLERTPRTDLPPVDPTTVGEAATTFLQGLVNAAGLQGSVSTKIEGENIDIDLQGDDLNFLVGTKGATLLALQDLTRVVSQRRLGDHETRLRVDVAGYREKRREALSRFALKVAADVKSSGQARALEPMNSADRKIVHDALVEAEGISTRSEGTDPFRRVVVALASTLESSLDDSTENDDSDELSEA
jgi:predicted RNA-binding protein Jag